MTNYKEEDILPIVARIVERYTSKESTSVTYETASKLMEAVHYCINEYKKYQMNLGMNTKMNFEANFEMNEEKEHSWNHLVLSEIEEKENSETHNISAKEAYEKGLQLVKDNVKRTIEDYNQLLLDFDAYGNRNYKDTVEKAIAGFFLYYDAEFAPQNTIITMDYPIIYLDQTLQGIDAISCYVSCITLENRFLTAISSDQVRSILKRFQQNYESQFYNLCIIVLRHVLGIMILNKTEEQIDEVEDPEHNRKQEHLEQWFLSHDEIYVKTCLKEQLYSLIKTRYHGDSVLFEYLCYDLDEFYSEAMHASKYNNLNHVVVL